MINKALFYHLTGVTATEKQLQAAPRLVATPGATAACFLEDGYAMEFYSMTGTDKLVSWFWGPGGFVIPTSPYSNLVVLGKAPKMENISYGKMVYTLRHHPELQVHYKKVREEHNRQIAERILDLKTLTPLEQYAKLLATKPWVFEYTTEADIASYLSISPGLLQQFRNNIA